MNDVLGYIRVILPRYAEAAQRKAMDAHSIRYITEGGKRGAGTRSHLLRMVRSGTVVAVLHLHLLADPKTKRKRGGTRADLWSVIDDIEKRGGSFWELYTDLRSTDREGRDRMTREAVETLARGRHKTRTSDKRGRPKKAFTDAEWAKGKAAWDSRKLKTWAAVQEKLPARMTCKDLWQKFGPRNSEEQ
jgi:hypothetical protein